MAKRKTQPEPQAKLDLHGFTVEIAFGQVKSMLARFEDRGYNLVEIVTGKSGIMNGPKSHLPKAFILLASAGF